MSELVVTILGCGTSRGVPSIPEDWGKCDPLEPKNRRLRSSIYLNVGGQSIVIDTTPDFRTQVLDNKIKSLDAVILTHDHADHTHGLDDVRGFAYQNQSTIPVFMNADTGRVISKRFDYAFEGKKGYPAICEYKNIQHGVPFIISGVEIIPFRQIHGRIESYGFRIGDFAYSTDLNDLPDESFQLLQGVKCWVVDALRYSPHPTHTHLEQTLSWIKRVGCDHAYLTHMAGDMDYGTLIQSLPNGVFPAYDGLKITI